MTYEAAKVLALQLGMPVCDKPAIYQCWMDRMALVAKYKEDRKLEKMLSAIAEANRYAPQR